MAMNMRLFSILFLCIAYVQAYEWDMSDFQEVECSLKLMVRNRFDGSLDYPSHPYRGDKKGSASNWCGYVAAKNFARPVLNSVSAVSGAWVVPAILPSAQHTYCSIWVGIDGYGSNSVEQLGTAHEFRNGDQVHYAWFEMYPQAAFMINNFPVQPGDVITASVVYQGNNVFVMSMANVTRKVIYHVPTSYTTSSAAQRICAEWIAEAPSLNGILPLAHFNNVAFCQCQATIGGVTGAINNSAWSNDRITMQTGAMSAKATASSLTDGGTAFTATWHHE